jgi:hypothetical protein
MATPAHASLDRSGYFSSSGCDAQNRVAAPVIGIFTVLALLGMMLVLILAVSAGGSGAHGFDRTPHPQPGTAPVPLTANR